MKRKITLMMLSGLLMLQPVTAQVKETVQAGGWQQKVSPLLCHQIRHSKAVTRSAGGGETYLGALVKVSEGQNGSVLRSKGAVLLDSLDQFYITLLPASRIEAMASTNKVVSIDAKKQPSGYMDRTHVTIGADKVQSGNQTLNIPAFTGKGVVVGISDSGFDYTHPLFRNADGSLCIKHAWDVYAPNSNGYGGIGAIYETKEALLAAQGSKDAANTHGTHVMGAAAGRSWKAFNYNQEEITYRGIAYEADVVAATAGLNTRIEEIEEALEEKLRHILQEGPAAEVIKANIESNNIISVLSIKIIFDYAKAHGNMPCVVNCSWGATNDFCERNTNSDEFLSKLIGPGRIIVAGAGNDADSHIYCEKPKGQYEWSPKVFLKTNEGTFTLHCDGEFNLDLEIYNKNNTTRPQFKLEPTFTSKNIRSMYDTEPDKNAWIWEYTTSEGKTEDILLEFFYIKGEKSGYDYKFKLSLPEEYKKNQLSDVVLKFGSDSDIRLLGEPDKIIFEEDNKFSNPYTQGWPGGASYIIGVGATSHRNKITNLEGYETEASGNIGKEGYIVNWSACGPTLDGRTKPDVVAPGYDIISARSKLYRTNSPKEWKDENEYVVAKNTFEGEEREMIAESGTSMASPVMSGVIALWLQAKPDLTTEQIMKTISRTSKHLDASMSYPNNVYGYGEVDAYAGLLDILDIKTSIPTLSTRQAAVTMNGRTLRIEGATEPLTVNVYNLSGQLVFTAATSADGTVTLPQLPAAVYAVQVGKIGSTLIRM